MGKTDRSPLQGKRVERDPGVRRTLLSEISKRFRLPKISAKHIAVSASALTVCAAIIIIALVSSMGTPVQAADICVGSEAGIVSPAEGVGRYPAEDSETSSPDAEAPKSDKSENSSAANGRFTVTFEFYGKDAVSCSAKNPATVGEFAERLGIVFDEHEVLSVSTDTEISEDTVISSDSVRYETVSVRSAVQYKTKYVNNSSMYSGNSKVTQKGVNGEAVTEYEIKYVNGVEVSRTETKTYVSKKPVDRIIEKGTKVYAPSSGGVTQNGSSGGGTFVGADGKTYRYSRYIDVKAVWYPSGGGTYIGLPADENIIAVDPNVIPLGSKVYITGSYADIGVRIAADIGTAVKGNVIDICFDRSNPLAANFGARPMRVYILE